jgi:hypothetical protein
MAGQRSIQHRSKLRQTGSDVRRAGSSPATTAFVRHAQNCSRMAKLARGHINELRRKQTTAGSSSSLSLLPGKHGGGGERAHPAGADHRDVFFAVSNARHRARIRALGQQPREHGWFPVTPRQAGLGHLRLGALRPARAFINATMAAPSSIADSQVPTNMALTSTSSGSERRESNPRSQLGKLMFCR